MNNKREKSALSNLSINQIDSKLVLKYLNSSIFERKRLNKLINK